MNTAAWVVSGVLAALYLTAGTLKTTQPLESLRGMMPWVDSVGTRVRLIGVAELLGAIGLVVPKLLDVVDDRSGVDGTLTGLAALGLTVIQLGAIPVHLGRREPTMLPLNVILAVASGFVAAARFGWF